MKQKLVLLSAAILICSSLFSQVGKQACKYAVDLTKVENNKLLVEITNIKLASKEAVFHMPKMIPGTYMVADYGRYVSNLKAFDKKGNELAVIKTDTNDWKINNATKLNSVTYWVEDILGTKKNGPKIYPMAATHIEEGKNFVINASGFFGYFENTKDLPITFDIIRPSNFYGSTGLIPVETGAQLPKVKKEVEPSNIEKRVDRYAVENYDRLIDSPLMYSKPDTSVIKVANSEVLIGAYSPNGKISAREIATTVQEVLNAQAKYLGGKLPVNKYAFMFFFTDEPIILFGALEHSYSSFYYMPEQTLDQMRPTLRNFAAHEFFHIVTPLNIHSEEIHHFGFNDPKMSKHLWLYEGVTEYFAGNVQVKYGLITPDEYLNVISQKMVAADNFLVEVPFTDISKFALDKYADQYGNVYQKGALIGMCLDIKLRSLSGGKYGLQNLMADLAKKYGKNKPFQDETLFSEIEALTYPQIGDFLRTCVGGANQLPFPEVMRLVGVSYVPEKLTKEFSLGFKTQAIGVAEVEGVKKLQIANMAGLTGQGKMLDFHKGDILVKINQETIPDLGPELGGFIGKHKSGLQEGGTLSYTVLRDNETGEKKEVELSSKVTRVESKQTHILSFDDQATAQELDLRKSWITAIE